MFHWFDVITNTRGDALGGWQVGLVEVGTQTVVPIFSDENSTPIASVSGVTNRAVADENGNYDFYVPSGTYTLQFFNTAGVFQRDQRFVAMFGADAANTANLAASGGSSLVGHIATGTGAVTRNVAAKLRDELSVFDFMSPTLAARISGRTSDASDAADTTAAILTAIAAANQRAIYFPPGVYNVNEIHVQQANVFLRGAGQTAVLVIQRTANADTFKFGPPLTGSFLSNTRIEGMTITHGPVVDASATGATVRFVQCNGYRLRDMSLNDSAEGLTVEGGQLGSLKTFNVFASSGTAKGAGSALLHFRQANLGAGVFQPCYTVQVEDFRLSASGLRDSCIRIASADGMTFTSGYIALGDVSLLNVQFDRDNSYVAGCSFTNTYFDCVNATTNAIVIPDDAFTNSFVFDLKIGSGCILGNGSGWGLLCTKPEIMVLSAQDARFVNFDTAAFEVENASGDLLDVTITGCHFQNCGSATSSVVRLNNGRILSIANNVFADNVNVQVTLTGNWRTGSVTGNVNAQTSVADLVRSGATFASPLVLAGNSSRRANAANSWIGDRLGNVNSDDPLVLDWYQEGTLTPTISFGGGSTGVTYSVQSGNYTRIGNRVFFNLSLTLSAKGSSTGTAIIGGLPFAADTSFRQTLTVQLSSGAAGVGERMQTASILSSTTSVDLFEANGFGQPVALTDTAFTATSLVVLAGSYRIA